MIILSWNSIQSLSGKDVKIILREFEEFIPDLANLLPKKGKTYRYINDKKESAIVVDHKEIMFIELKNQTIPSLRLLKTTKFSFPTVVVDIGAIRFVTNGADIMRPGITQISEEVTEANLVVILEEKNKTPISVGQSKYDAVDLKNMNAGKCIRNLHYLTDEWWNFRP
ncbi:MAG: RNA-binding protein [Candidatus Heimdallarchaeota archaeon]|nr:RNA-binding protein [Candidatus Heimdallarchaeota archaeon]